MKFIHAFILWLGFVALALLLVSGPVYRFELVDLGTAFLLFRWAAYLGAAAVILNIILLLLRKKDGPHISVVALAALAGFISFYMPYQMMQKAKSVPPIHDITTDTQNPPEFVAILPLRMNAPNDAHYGGEAVAQQQLEAYPDIKTLHLQQGAEQVFEAAQQVVKAMGWQLVSANQPLGRIEATDTTTWFGFKDDVVIRISPDNGATNVDVRSVSRVGKSDVGKNAERIRNFLEQLQQQLK